MIHGITDLSTFIVGTIVIVLLPGPNSLFVLAVAARRGIGPGYRAACGVFAGDFILMLLSATGAASLLMASPALFALIKTAGALYLSWLGLSLLRNALDTWRPADEPRPPPADSARTERPFRGALLISLMNPKAILFFVSFFIQFVDPAYPQPAIPFLILGLIVQICSASYLSLLIFAGVRLANAFHRRRRIAATATGGVGVLFIGFGARLAAATLD